jgi:hypothetical protein
MRAGDVDVIDCIVETAERQMEKLGISDFASLIRFALQHGLTSLD